MDAAKVWTPLILLAILVGGIFLFRHLDLVDKANADFITAREVLKMAEESLVSRTNHLEGMSKAMTKAKEHLASAEKEYLGAQQSFEKADASLADAEKLRRQVEGDLSYLVNSLPAAVEKVRSSAIGTTLPSVTLGDGKQLKQAQIKKVEDNGISFIHSEGFGIVPVENLPVDLVQKYDLGPGSLLKQADKLKQEAGTITGKSTDAENAASPSRVINDTAFKVTNQPAPKASTGIDESKIKKIDLRLAEVTAQINAALRNKSGWADTADNYARQVSDAGFRGVPTTKLREAESNARNQITLIVQQINQLEAEYRRLEVERSAAIRGVK